LYPFRFRLLIRANLVEESFTQFYIPDASCTPHKQILLDVLRNTRSGTQLVPSRAQAHTIAGDPRRKMNSGFRPGTPRSRLLHYLGLFHTQNGTSSVYMGSTGAS
jgi:hypothetical protein